MPHRILLVDDDPHVRSVMLRALVAAGYEADEAADGAVALRKLEQGSYALVITDLLMPERDGLELIMHLRRVRPQTPIIAVSGAATDLYLHDARGLGATRVLRKPFRPSELLDLVRETLNEGPPAPPPPESAEG